MIIRTPGGRFRARVYYRGATVADRTFDRRADAKAWEQEQVRMLRGGTSYVPPVNSRVTVAQLANEYLDSRAGKVAVRSWESDESNIRVHIVPAWGKLPLDAVTPARVDQLLTQIAKQRSWRTAAKIRTTVRGLFRYAVLTSRVQISPAEKIPVPRPDQAPTPRSQIRPFTLPELLEVVAEQRQLAGDYADLTLVLALTGVRLGELRALQVNDLVQIPYPSLQVRRSVPQSARTGKMIERSTTKSGRMRTVPLTEILQPVIAAWAEGKAGEELLFPAPEGGYLRAGNWRRTVHWDQTCRGRRPNDLRHTAASLWISAGLDIKTIQHWLGHATAKLTLDTYGHLMGTDAEKVAIARFNESVTDPTPTQTSRRSPQKEVNRTRTGL